jgi:4-hydroxy-2-oxoheptanedioate aldolase
MRRSKILEKIGRGEVVSIVNPSFTNSFRVVEMAGLMGFDGAWIDMEHRDFDYHDAAVMTLAARAADMDSIVRIRKDSYADYFRPLEDGATGIMVPHIKTRAEAEVVVYNAKYHPIGRRGMDGVGADTFYGLGDTDIAKANRETFILVQIEDFESIEVIEEIIGVEGIGGILVGPADLAQSYKVPGEFKHPNVLAAMERVGKACAEVGKWWGAPGLDSDHTRWLIDHGAQFIALVSDYGMILNGFRKSLEGFHELLEGMGR